VLAAARPDRARTASLQALAEEVRAATARWRDPASEEAALHQMLDASGGDFVPSHYRDAEDVAVG
ncbi:MAG: hypothetical protein ACYCZP_17970, partial [Acidimicrobiales bacterium]